MANEREGGPRMALVVGNSAYETVGPLENPKHDAAAMVTALQGLGFEVISAIDLKQAELLARLQEFYGRLDRNSTALLFYAGHGVQVWGQNYLLPCDTRIARASDLRSSAVPLNDVVRAMARRAKTRLLFLDACRNDPISNEAGGLTRGARELGQSSLKVLQLQHQVAEHKKQDVAKEPSVAEKIRQLEGELASALQYNQALSWRSSYQERFLPLLGAGAAALIAFLTLLLSAGAISGWHQLRLWGPSIRGGALAAATGVLVWSLYSHSVWNDTTIGVLLAVCGFLTLGLMRAAAADEALPALPSA